MQAVSFSGLSFSVDPARVAPARRFDLAERPEGRGHSGRSTPTRPDVHLLQRGPRPRFFISAIWSWSRFQSLLLSRKRHYQCWVLSPSKVPFCLQGHRVRNEVVGITLSPITRGISHVVQACF